MKSPLRTAGWIFVLLAIGILAIVLIHPEVAATQYGYFDVNNGRKKLVLVSFGRTYREVVEDTEYSRLLKELGFQEEPADWKLATQVEFGLCRLIYPFVDRHYGSMQAHSGIFASVVKSRKIDPAKAHDLAVQFRTLIQQGNRTESKKLVVRLQLEE